jgi:hypothetical protein
MSSTTKPSFHRKYSHVQLVNTMRINITLSTTLCMSSYIKCTTVYFSQSRNNAISHVPNCVRYSTGIIGTNKYQLYTG